MSRYACRTALAIAVSIFLIMGGCARVEPPEPRPGLGLLVYPDVTGSIDDEAFQNVKKDLKQILQAVPYQSRVEVIPIGEARNPSTATEIKYPPKTEISIERQCVPKCRKRRDHLKSWITQQDSILDRVRQRYQANVSVERSCLLNAFESVESRGRNLLEDNDIDKVHVVFISDMVEECNDTPIGSLVMTDETMESALSKIDRWDKEREWETLHDKDVTFSVIKKSPTDRIRNSVSDPDRFWRAFLSRFGEEGKKWGLNRKPQDIINRLKKYGEPAMTRCEDVCG